MKALPSGRRVLSLSPPTSVFLTHTEVPPDQRIRVGDEVRIRTPRTVSRVGYRLHTRDREVRAQAEAICEGPAGSDLREALGAAGLTLPQNELVQVIARGLVWRQKFGGRHRGVRLHETSPDGTVYAVEAIRFAKLGEYYPPSGGYDSWTGEYDAEPGGLAYERTVRICRIQAGEFLSGDLELLPSEGAS